MTGQEFLQTVFYPGLATAVATLLPVGIGVGVWYLKKMAATWQAQADATALNATLERGKALAVKEGVTGDDDLAKKIAEYLHTTSPDLALRTGMAKETTPMGVSNPDTKVLVSTAGAVQRIDAQIAQPSPAPVNATIVGA